MFYITDLRPIAAGPGEVYQIDAAAGRHPRHRRGRRKYFLLAPSGRITTNEAQQVPLAVAVVAALAVGLQAHAQVQRLSVTITQTRRKTNGLLSSAPV